MKNVLVGKTIQAVYLSQDREAIKFVLDNGDEVIARCDGDCCSYTWIESVELPSLPAHVRSAEDVDLPETASVHETSVDCVAYYGLKLVTSTGHLIIDYRNNSNGYYGGSLVWPGDYFYGGVYDQNGSTEGWVKLS